MTAVPSPIKVTWSTAVGFKVFFVNPKPNRTPSNADNFAGIIQVDRGGARYFRKARHQHDVAGNDHDESGSAGQRCVRYAQRPPGWRAEDFRIVGEGVLRFRDANRQLRVTPLRKLLQLVFGLFTETDITRSVNVSRNLLNLFHDGLIELVNRPNVWRRILVDQL